MPVCKLGFITHTHDGGGGGGKHKENFKIFGTLCAQSRKIKLCMRSAPQNWKFFMFSSIFYINFHGFVVPDSAF